MDGLSDESSDIKRVASLGPTLASAVLLLSSSETPNVNQVFITVSSKSRKRS